MYLVCVDKKVHLPHCARCKNYELRNIQNVEQLETANKRLQTANKRLNEKLEQSRKDLIA